MLEITDIRYILQVKGALPVYQLAILDFLNTAKFAKDIAGTEPMTGPISDDPNRGPQGGYDIGLTVARRILKKRRERGGQFKSLEELARIPYFGKDKFNDLVYTFMQLRAPIPTGLGVDFDNFIKAVSALEVSALQSGLSVGQTLSAIRKLFYDNSIPAQNQEGSINLNWDNIIPASRNIHPPGSWGAKGELLEAVNYIERNKEILVGTTTIHTHSLIAALDARSHPSQIITSTDKINLQSNHEVASYLLGVSSPTYQYLSPFTITPRQDFKIEEEALNSIYNAEVKPSVYVAIADSYHLDFHSSRSLSWNLLAYYTDSENPYESRYQTLAQTLNLGEYKDGLLSRDNIETRSVLVDKTQLTNFFLLRENGQGAFVNRMFRGLEEDSAYFAYRSGSAYTIDLFIDRLTILVSLEINKPSILSWNRLEARPRSEDFSRALRAEVRDPLWFISRQWQFGEFRAEDTGSALEMRVDMETTKINRYALRDQTAKTYDPAIPMETTVEREPVDRDLTIRQEMGKQFERFLQTRLSASPSGFAQSTIDNVKADFKATANLQFSLPTPAEDHPVIYSNPSLLKTYVAIGSGRMLDGSALYDLLKSGTLASSFVSSTSSVNALGRIDNAGNDLIAWFENTYNQPASSSDSAWNASQLEYQFHCSAPTSNNSTAVLSTDEYANGHLDWYSFDFETLSSKYDPTLTNGSPDTSLIQRKLITVLPTDLKYPGMPLARWWQFEDFKVDLGAIKTSTNELPKLLMAEFALIYSNDWMLLPFDVEVGSLCNIKSIIVRDVFGQHTSVQPAGAGTNNDWQRWSMFNLNRRNLAAGDADNRLFVPPAVVRTMESEPVEQVGLLRDEMANMVFGVEKSVPNGLGGHMDGRDSARRLYDYLVSITPEPAPSAPPVANNAAIRYQLGTTVPEHWIPFIPVRKGGVNSRQIQLRRAAMPRLIEGRTPERIRPRTELLKTGYDPVADTWGPYFLHEEEVPRSGVLVNRFWQRTRWMDGEVFTWLGRRVRNGRGEANSGLEYDLVKEKET